MDTLDIDLKGINLRDNVKIIGDNSSCSSVSNDLPKMPSLPVISEIFVPNYEHEESCNDVIDHLESEADIHEPIPRYECTLTKKGTVCVRHELGANGICGTDRKWYQVILSVEGTKVTIDYGSTKKASPSLLTSLGIAFSHTDNTKIIKDLPSYFRCLMLEGAVLLSADEHAHSKPNIFRMLLKSGEQLLIRAGSVRTALGWVETLQSVINISSDLDSRQEPQFTLHRVIYESYHYL